MIALHYIISYLKLSVAIHYFLKLQKQRKTEWINATVIIFLAFFDAVRYSNLGYHAIRNYDAFFYIGLTIPIMHYALNKQMGYFPLLIVHIFITFSTMLAGGFIFTIFSLPVGILTESPFNSLIGGFLGLIFLLALCYLASKFNFNLEINLLTKRELVAISVSLITFSFLIANLIIVGNIRNETLLGNFINLLTMLGGISGLSVAIALLAKNTHVKKLENKNRIQEIDRLRQKQHYETIKKQDKEMRKFRHDIRKQLKSLHGKIKLGNSHLALEQIEMIIGNYNEIESLTGVKTGSNSTDANLFFLRNEPKHSNTHFEWDGVVPNNLQISEDDLTHLMVNALENSFDATSKIKTDGYVKVKIKPDKYSLYIRVANNYEGKLNYKNDYYTTTKNDKENHGFGLSIMKEVVKKYKGEIEIYHDDSEFSVEIMFSKNVYDDNNLS